MLSLNQKEKYVEKEKYVRRAQESAKVVNNNLYHWKQK